MDSLRHLGDVVARTQDDDLDRFDFAAQRAQFLRHAARRGRSVRARRGLIVCAAAAVVAMVVALALRPSAPLTFQVAGAPGSEGNWIAAPEGAPVALSFSDGTELRLERNARARVLDVEPTGARVVLERGMLSAQVAHRQSARWWVNAGPFRVRVVGTVFEVSWDPANERLVLVLRDGAVSVSGPTIDGERSVEAGERIEIGLGSRPEAEPVARASAVDARAPAPRATSGAPEAEPGDAIAPNASALNLRSWRELFLAGAHAEAWAVVDGEGFAALVASGSAKELRMLADVARFTGHPVEAVLALTELRRRLPTSPEAGDAAFLLGRTAFDQRGSPADALAWFQTYLTERPGGAFAREALGRVIECQQQLGASDAARRAAKEYLQRYPDGPHAPIARLLLRADGAPGSDAPSSLPESDAPSTP